MAAVRFDPTAQRRTFFKMDDPHDWARGVPYNQPYYLFSPDTQQWQPVTPSTQTQTQLSSAAPAPLDKFEVLSWNIDFMRILDDERMIAALNHLRTHVDPAEADQSATVASVPKVIMLNEMTRSDLILIQGQDWIREGYHVTDISTEYWESEGYGTCMLIPKAMPISSVCRIHYTKTAMQRDALFVDIFLDSSNATSGDNTTTTGTNDPPLIDLSLSPTTDSSEETAEPAQVLRFCTTHLESMRANPPKRPKQLAEAAAYMRRAAHAVLGGDLNAIQDFDATLHIDNGLRDAYLESITLAGAKSTAEDEGEGMTWGQTASIAERKRYGLCRMDKFLFCSTQGGEGGKDGKVLKVEEFERFGEDVEVESQESRELLIEEVEMEKGWVTDHLGIKAAFRIH